MSELVRLAKEALRQQKALDPIPTIQPGTRITWQGADTTERSGVVDFVYAAPDGTSWAFCSLQSGWCAVNLKHAVKHQDTGHE